MGSIRIIDITKTATILQGFIAQDSNAGDTEKVPISLLISSLGASISITESQITDLDKYTQAEVDSLLAAKENTFAKNTGFNKNFGTAAGTVSEGNHTHTEFTGYDSHVADTDIHFLQSQISITESQVSDLDKYTQAEVDSLLALYTKKIAEANQNMDGFNILMGNGNITGLDNISGVSADFSGSGKFGNTNKVVLEGNDTNNFARTVYNTLSHTNTMFVIGYETGLMAIKNLAGGGFDITGTNGNIVKFNNNKSTAFYGDANHNNHNVTNIDNLSGVSADFTGSGTFGGRLQASYDATTAGTLLADFTNTGGSGDWSDTRITGFRPGNRYVDKSAGSFNFRTGVDANNFYISVDKTGTEIKDANGNYADLIALILNGDGNLTISGSVTAASLNANNGFTGTDAGGTFVNGIRTA